MTSPPPAPTVVAGARARRTRTVKRTNIRGAYPLWFLLPAAVVFGLLFLAPTVSSIFFSLTRWNLFSIEFIGLANYPTLFQDPGTVPALINTGIYTFGSAAVKIVIGALLGALFASQIIGRNYLRAVMFAPLIITTIGIGFAWKAILDDHDGVLNTLLAGIGIQGPGWLTDPHLVIYTLTFVDVWRGIGLSALIYLAGMVAIPREYYEAAKVDGAGWWQSFRRITLPLLLPATTTVAVLTIIHGVRSFDLIWAMTQGGPGFSSDVIASIVYKYYQAGFYGLSAAGNVVILAIVAVIVMPIFFFLTGRETDR